MNVMRYFTSIFSVAVVLSLTACRSQKQTTSYDPMQQLAAARAADIPLPATTPFDSVPDSRTAYLQAYHDGYQSGLVSLNVQIQKPDERDAVRSQGWRDGASAGLSAHLAAVIRKDQK